MGPKKPRDKVGVDELEEIMQIKALWGHGIPKSPTFLMQIGQGRIKYFNTLCYFLFPN